MFDACYFFLHFIVKNTVMIYSETWLAQVLSKQKRAFSKHYMQLPDSYLSNVPLKCHAGPNSCMIGYQLRCTVQFFAVV